MRQNRLLYAHMETDLQHRFLAHLKQLQLDATQLYLLAVSGGVDSVVLCELCYRAGLPFSILHCNFQLRAEESDRDEAFVRSLGKKYKVEVLVQHFDTKAYAADKGLSTQEAARNLRYHWFETVRIKKGSPYVLLAHHANDNIETLLMHFFRGTGLHGLTGMPQQSEHMARCLRPLLPFRRKEIEAFATAAGLQWVEDSSNQSDKYTRNFFRNTLIPQLQKVYPQVEENLLQNIDRLAKTNSLYQQLLQKEKQTFYKRNGAEIRIAVNKLLQYRHTAMIYEVLKDFHFTEGSVPQLLKLAQSESGHFMENEAYRIIRHRAWFVIVPKAEKKIQTFVIKKGDKKLYLPDAVLELEAVAIKNFNLKKSNSIAQLDARHVTYPLLVRRWRQGDYFYPLGMLKKKKLARFFIDHKLSIIDKEKVWVVESGKRIIWVAGYRIDDRFKITPHTQQVLQLKITTL